MAEMNKNEDPPQTLKFRPRPEIQRPIIPPPGGLPMPPSRQQNVTQTRRSPLPQSQQEVDQSSRALSRSETTTSTIPTPDTLPTYSEQPQLSGTMPIDVFGLPDFRFPIMSTSDTGFGIPLTVFSSIKSPTHLPKLANIKITNPFGSPSARSGILGSNLPSTLQLPSRPLKARSSRDLTTRDLHEINSSSESSSKDLPRRTNRSTDLLFFKESSTSLFSDPGPNKHGTSSNILSSSKTSKESDKSSNFIWTSDRSSETNLKSTPMPDPSDVEGNLGNVSGASSMNIPITSASVHSPGPSSIAASSDSYNPQGILNVKRSSDPMPVCLPGPSKIRGTGDSMSSIAQHPDAPSKSKSLYGKFMRFLRKGLNVKKTRSGLEDKEESTGLVFEREGEQELRPKPSHREPERECKYVEVDLFGNWLKREPPVFPYTEVEKKCYTCNNFTIGSPTVSVLSNTSTSKSEPDLASIDGPSSQAIEPISKSNPTSPSTERKCTCNSASETSESASTTSPIPGISESPKSNRNPTPGISESPTSNPEPEIL